jgi:ribosomal protein S18 acetylase RimI-like enzyme
VKWLFGLAGAIGMKVYSHEDPNLKQFLQKISRITKQVEATKLPYWVFVQDSDPVGIVIVGKEPIQLLAPPGSSMAFVELLNMRVPKESIRAFAAEALKLAGQRNVEYALAKFPFNEDVAINQFKTANFEEFDDCYHMICKLDKTFNLAEELQLRRVKKGEMRQFIEYAGRFLQGSPDVALEEALQHISELPDEFLELYYTQEEFFIAYKNEQPVGILNLNTAKGLISNVAVDRNQRGKGYGRQLIIFGLQELKKKGCEQAYLRVHVENKPAIRLYESLGFTKAEQYKRLIWRRH